VAEYRGPIVNSQSGQCLDDSPGVGLVVNPCNATEFQDWQLGGWVDGTEIEPLSTAALIFELSVAVGCKPR
jgi:hypothetical protein